MTPNAMDAQGNPVPPPPVTVHDRVVLLVKLWALLDTLPSDSDLLTVLWASKAASKYNPDGAQLLAMAISKEFSAPPVICQCITVDDLTQRIKTVANLVKAVLECPQP
jgi:hypothetical protein